MNFVQYITILFFTLFISTNTFNAQKWERKDVRTNEVTRTIIVDKSGGGNFTKVQDAIDSIPSNNNVWVKIVLKRGIYNEKVLIPVEKQFIALVGESRANTVIQFGEFGHSIESSTFNVQASNFVAHKILFKNTYNKVLAPSLNGKRVTWAPAMVIQGDKLAFYDCGFVGIQDTLTDMAGRHYFKSCYIEGAIDFIWGNGQSFYEECAIKSTGRGSITAQGRDTPKSTSGFVFRECTVTGTGPTYLGRAHGKHSRVIYYRCVMDNIIHPEGWDQWGQKGSDGFIFYAEILNKGPGANMSERVKWEKKVTAEDVQPLVLHKYINEGNWLQQQPLGLYSDNKAIA